MQKLLQQRSSQCSSSKRPLSFFDGPSVTTLDPHDVQLWMFCWPTKEPRADFRTVVEVRDPTVRGAQVSWCRKLAPLPATLWSYDTMVDKFRESWLDTPQQ